MFGGFGSFGSQALGSATISAPQNLGFVLYLNGVATTALMSGTMLIETAINQRGTARFTLVNPPTIPEAGWQVIAQQDEDRLFRGTIDRVTVKADESGNATFYDCDCVDLSQILDCLVWTSTYVNQTAQQVMLDVFRNKLTAEGIVPFVIDQGGRSPCLMHRK